MKWIPKLTGLLLLLTTLTSFAQFRLTAGGGSIKGDVQRIVDAYPQNFATIKGEILNKNPQSVEYASKIKLDGNPECMVIEYSSDGKPIYSWQAVLVSTEEFEVAAKKYKWLYNQLKGMNVYYLKDQYTLRGRLDEADESRKFCSSVLTLAHPPSPLKRLKVEVSMQFEFPEWKVMLLVYEKERDDDEPGHLVE